MLEKFRLDDRVAVITGGGGGLGSLAARTFASVGADVALLGRNVDNLEAAAGVVRELGRTAHVIQADVSDPDSMADAARSLDEVAGRIDILFNNAGVTSTKTLLDTDPADWQALMDVNVTGTYLTIRAFAPAMIRGGGGRIINMGSILSARGMANRVAYSATKSAVPNIAAANVKTVWRDVLEDFTGNSLVAAILMSMRLNRPPNILVGRVLKPRAHYLHVNRPYVVNQSLNSVVRDDGQNFFAVTC